MKITFKGSQIGDGVRGRIDVYDSDKSVIESKEESWNFNAEPSHTIIMPDLPGAKYYRVGIWDLELAAPVSVSRDGTHIYTFQAAEDETRQYTPLMSVSIISTETAIMWLIVAAAIVIALYFIFK